MNYVSFTISKYRAIDELEIKLDDKLIPLVGINECGKTTILQAIYSFDHLNDEEYGGKHINSIRNLYNTTDHVSIISAKIALTHKDIILAIKSLQSDIAKNIIKFQAEDKAFSCDIDVLTKEIIPMGKEIQIVISRNITTKKYSTPWNHKGILNSETINNEFCEAIMSRMPYILYNDDFADRPPSEVTIPATRPTTALTGWLAIYERLFKLTNPDYSLFSIITEPDQRRRDSVLSDVEELLNSKLSVAWKSFSTAKSGTINVSLKIKDSTEKLLQISIVEKLEGKNRYFDVLDRSKGFVWHYNFIMKTQFNPKVIGKIEDTVFLLDEPGSYLHSSAQEKLCSKLSEISKQYGIVIYCTHSHHLLNPDIIPIKNILIVEKNKKKKIIATPLPTYSTKTGKTTALQPIFEALNIPIYEVYSDDSTLVLTEGINDKLTIELFTNIPKNYKILPGTSADSILKNIPYMLAYDKKFIALWDNDNEGQLSKKRASTLFHLDDNHLKFLPLEGLEKRRMEEMLSKKDLLNIAIKLGMSSDSSYDILIPSMYYSTAKLKKEIMNEISEQTKKSFSILEKILFT